MPNPVDDMKALLSKRGESIARGNRYGVHISHPPLRGQPR